MSLSIEIKKIGDAENIKQSFLIKADVFFSIPTFQIRYFEHHMSKGESTKLFRQDLI